MILLVEDFFMLPSIYFRLPSLILATRSLMTILIDEYIHMRCIMSSIRWDIFNNIQCFFFQTVTFTLIVCTGCGRSTSLIKVRHQLEENIIAPNVLALCGRYFWVYVEIISGRCIWELFPVVYMGGMRGRYVCEVFLR